MGRLIYVNRTEARILATALNNSRISYYSLSERDAIPKLARRLSGFMADGESELPNESKAKAAKLKKITPFARLRAEDEELKQLHADMYASVTPHPIRVVDERLPLPVTLDYEAAYATLKDRPK
jgi:hypothetical protein